jgi:hypothetical protein
MLTGQKRIDKEGETFEVLSEPYYVGIEGQSDKMVDIRSPSDGLTICSLPWLMQQTRKVA